MYEIQLMMHAQLLLVTANVQHIFQMQVFLSIMYITYTSHNVVPLLEYNIWHTVLLDHWPHYKMDSVSYEALVLIQDYDNCQESLLSFMGTN